MKDRELTHYGKPDETLNSQYGVVTYRKWCELEVSRINRRGGEVEIATRLDGQIAIVRKQSAAAA